MTLPAGRRLSSLVLLLRAPAEFTADQVESAQERAWGRSFRGSDDSRFFVVHDGVTFIKCGDFLFSMLPVGRPYEPAEKGHVIGKANPAQQAAWRDHQAWLGLDIMSDDEHTPGARMAALARTIRPLISENCLALYIPSMARTVASYSVVAAVLEKLQEDFEQGTPLASNNT